MAIGDALDAIRLGRAHTMFAGGAEPLKPRHHPVDRLALMRLGRFGGSGRACRSDGGGGPVDLGGFQVTEQQHAGLLLLGLDGALGGVPDQVGGRDQQPEGELRPPRLGQEPDSRFCNKCGAPITPAATSAEYKQVTILFADVVRSMDIAAAVGAERLREIMAELVNCASSVVHRYGGTVDKFTVGLGQDCLCVDRDAAVLEPMARLAGRVDRSAAPGGRPGRGGAPAGLGGNYLWHRREPDLQTDAWVHVGMLVNDFGCGVCVSRR